MCPKFRDLGVGLHLRVAEGGSFHPQPPSGRRALITPRARGHHVGCSARCPSADSRPSLTPMSGADFAKRHEEAERVHALRVAMRAANAAKPAGTKATLSQALAGTAL